MDAKVYEIWLSLACTPDTATFSRLTDSFDSAEEVYNATEKQIRSAVGPNASDCTRLIDKDLTRAQSVYSFCTSKGVGLLSYYDDEFPESLKSIPTPPVLLYYRGKLPDFNKGFRCAIVGTRMLSDNGRINAFRLGYDMGKAGATVVSGMAVGIDGVALAGAIAAGSPTIAVLGSGIDVCYPKEHLRLAQEIVKFGCVMTEYAPGTKPEKYNFPRRNRIISGLCAATVVVEGREDSGSMITARHAKAQGRAVFAVPGNVGNEHSQASNLLIKNGASLCTGADDIVSAFEKTCGTALNPFNLPVKREVNMNAVLTELKVCATTPSDDIFKAPRVKRAYIAEDKPVESSPVVTVKTDAPLDTGVLPAFDPATLRIYKKIPLDEECAIESLVDADHTLRDVMKLLLKLEMSRFVVMLPGEKVKRNLR